jgi:hypothetical protein
MKPDKTCGTCAFGLHLKPIDLTRRHCHGAPPQILTIPQQRMKGIGPAGKPIAEMTLTLQNARPIVNASDPQCALYQPRTFEDVATVHDKGEVLDMLPVAGAA